MNIKEGNPLASQRRERLPNGKTNKYLQLCTHAHEKRTHQLTSQKPTIGYLPIPSTNGGKKFEGKKKKKKKKKEVGKGK